MGVSISYLLGPIMVPENGTIKDVRNYLWVAFILSSICMLMIFIYLPNKPTNAPSKSSTMKRSQEWEGFKKLLRCIMRDQINEALKEAVKAKNSRKSSTLRLINAAIKDRDIAARSSDNTEGVSDDEILEILSKMVKQRVESAETYKQANRQELLDQELEEIEIIKGFLPRQLDEDESRAAVESVIKETEASGLKDMGRVMGELKARYTGQMDFGKVSSIVKDLLG